MEHRLSFGREISAFSSRIGRMIVFKRNGYAISTDSKAFKGTNSLESSTHISPSYVSETHSFLTKAQSMA